MRSSALPLFRRRSALDDRDQLTAAAVKGARQTGRLDLSSRCLLTVPDKLWQLYDKGDGEVEEVLFDQPSDEPWWSHRPLEVLDLSSNSLQSLPSQIAVHDAIAQLNLQKNSLTSLPEEIGCLQRLNRLDASHNQLAVLPKALFSIEALQQLNLAHNRLQTVPEQMSDLIMLQSLDISHNLVESLCPGLGFLVRLTELDVSHNQLTELPPDIVNMRALKTLDVSHNGLMALPAMGELRRLQVLNAASNRLADLPDFTGCSDLREANFASNCIQSIEEDFCEQMGHLKVLNLRQNQLKELPPTVYLLHALTRLDVSANSLTSLPNRLCLLCHLELLLVDGNPVQSVRRDVLASGTPRILRWLRQKLHEEEGENTAEDLQLLALTTSVDGVDFPSWHVMKASRTLNLGLKGLTAVPDAVFADALRGQVTAVDLCKNRLSHVPNGIKLLGSQLTELILSSNLICRLAEDDDGDCGLALCSSLAFLDLSDNRLVDLPACLGRLLMLRELVLSRNKFDQLPACIYSMTGLEVLKASDNKVAHLDVEGLGRLRRLATLDLANNEIRQVPPQLGNLKQLRHLELMGNGFRQPRHAILAKGTEAILAYLRDRIAN